jgi:hypothetical protein
MTCRGDETGPKKQSTSKLRDQLLLNWYRSKVILWECISTWPAEVATLGLRPTKGASAASGPLRPARLAP